MGFRGSRVQIPPSRLVLREAPLASAPAVLRASENSSAVCGPFLQSPDPDQGAAAATSTGWTRSSASESVSVGSQATARARLMYRVTSFRYMRSFPASSPSTTSRSDRSPLAIRKLSAPVSAAGHPLTVPVARRLRLHALATGTALSSFQRRGWNSSTGLRRRQDETHPGDDQPRPAPPSVADVNRHLGRVRPGDQVRRAQVIQELLTREPAPAAHDLVLHHGDVGRGAAERDGAELEKQDRQRAERGAMRCRRRCPTHVLRRVTHSPAPVRPATAAGDRTTSRSCIMGACFTAMAASLFANVPFGTAARTAVSGGTKYVSSLRKRSCSSRTVALTITGASAAANRFHMEPPAIRGRFTTSSI